MTAMAALRLPLHTPRQVGAVAGARSAPRCSCEWGKRAAAAKRAPLTSLARLRERRAASRTGAPNTP